MGRFLTNREMYIYFKDYRMATSRKLSGVIESHCVSLDFAGGPKESDGEVAQEKFAIYTRTIDGHLNSESVEKQFGQSNVYDGTQVISNNYRIPGSRAKVKLTLEKKRAPVGKNNKERKISQLVGISQAKVIIINIERNFGVGRAIIIKISEGARHRMFDIRGGC